MPTMRADTESLAFLRMLMVMVACGDADDDAGYNGGGDNDSDR